MDKRIRLDVERKQIRTPSVVVTFSSLETRRDDCSVDMVVQVGSPGDIATALQRIGRAGHHVGGIPRAILPSNVDDDMELAADTGAIQTGDMDRLDFPENCLDVLAQYLIGLVIINDRISMKHFRNCKSIWSYRNLGLR